MNKTYILFFTARYLWGWQKIARGRARFIEDSEIGRTIAESAVSKDTVLFYNVEDFLSHCLDKLY